MDTSTDGGDQPIDDISFLANSAHRIELLHALQDGESLTRRELRSSVDASRSAVRRTLEGFLGRDWVESANDGVRLTAAGAMIADEFDRLAKTAEVADAKAPLLRWLPAAEVDIEPAWLEDGTLTVSTETNPYAPARRQTETVETAARFRGFLPSMELEGTKLVHERITAGEFAADIVLSADGGETFETEPFAALNREMLETGRLDVSVYPGELPFYLGLPDEEGVEIGGMDTEGIPRVLFQSTRPELREWGETTFERYRTAATRIDETDV